MLTFSKKNCLCFTFKWIPRIPMANFYFLMLIKGTTQMVVGNISSWSKFFSSCRLILKLLPANRQLNLAQIWWECIALRQFAFACLVLEANVPVMLMIAPKMASYGRAHTTHTAAVRVFICVFFYINIQ